MMFWSTRRFSELNRNGLRRLSSLNECRAGDIEEPSKKYSKPRITVKMTL